MQSSIVLFPLPTRMDDSMEGTFIIEVTKTAYDHGFGLSFDYYLSETLAPSKDFGAPTRLAQSTLYQRWRGFAPPGTCTLVPLVGTDCGMNQHDCKFIALCPTMRTPENVNWDFEVVYECTWSLLVAIDNHNAIASASGQPKIAKIIVPGLATGVGGVSVEKCAVQMALAIKHYVEAVSNPEKWSKLRWNEIYVSASEVEETREL
jgi:O-acetyl-ADP-ribose deacetylase (regulator of RNase III)